MSEPAAALERLDRLTRRLRRECPWDREQDERSIVPHTVEEAYELADAVRGGDDAKVLDELGDVLFQVQFLALLLEERGAGSLLEVVEHVERKLIRRHPHVFSDGTASSAEEVRASWERIKREQEGRAEDPIPENLPSLLHARKAQARVAGTGFDFPGWEVALDSVRDELAELELARSTEDRFAELGDVLFAAVNLSRKLSLDPELALRGATQRFQRRLADAAAEAEAAGERWEEISVQRQLQHYAAARMHGAP